MAEIKSLSAKLALIANEIGAIAKDGKNAQQGYAYIEYAQVAAKARELQAKHGVAIIPTVDSYTAMEVKNKYGGIGYHYLIKMIFTVINAEDPEDKIVSNWIGEATDYGDKGINKAITSGVKYFIMRLYNISEKGEQEADAVTPEPNVWPKQKKQNMESVSAQKPKINWDKVNEIRDKVASITTVDELESYWRNVRDSLSETDKRAVLRHFEDRKKKIAPPEDPDYVE